MRCLAGGHGSGFVRSLGGSRGSDRSARRRAQIEELWKLSGTLSFSPSPSSLTALGRVWTRKATARCLWAHQKRGKTPCGRLS